MHLQIDANILGSGKKTEETIRLHMEIHGDLLIMRFPEWILIIYIYIIWLLIKILSRNGHSSRINILLSRNFRELHVYLSRGPCWPTTPLMKIRSPPAKLRQRITDHFLVHWRKSEDQGPWCLALAKPHFWKLGYCYSHSLVPFSCWTPGGSGWQPFTYNDNNTQLSRNFRETKFYFRELEKNFREGFQHNMHGFRN